MVHNMIVNGTDRVLTVLHTVTATVTLTTWPMKLAALVEEALGEDPLE